MPVLVCCWAGGTEQVARDRSDCGGKTNCPTYLWIGPRRGAEGLALVLVGTTLMVVMRVRVGQVAVVAGETFVW